MDVLGHPTGRVIGLREGVQIDLGEVSQAAVDAGVALEMSAYPDRMDLDAETVRSLDAAPLIILGTEAAFPNELTYWEWAEAAAEQSGLPPERIMNTRPAEQLKGRRWRR